MRASRTLECSEHKFDCQHVITMSLEKISSERKRRSGANLHRSLMICDLLVRLRTHVLASEGSEVNEHEQSSTINIPNSEDLPSQCEASIEQLDDTETNEQNRCNAEESSSEEQWTQSDVCDVQQCETATLSSQDWRCDASQLSKSEAPAQPDELVQPAAYDIESQQPLCTQYDTNRLTAPLVQSKQGHTVALCERRRKRRLATTNEDELADADKRCRMVPESCAEAQPDSLTEPLPAAPVGYIAVPLTVLTGGLNSLAYGLNGYVLNGLNGGVLLAYPTQLCSPKSLDSLLTQTGTTLANESNLPLVFVIN